MNSEALRIKIIVEVLRQGHCVVAADLISSFIAPLTSPQVVSPYDQVESKARELAQVNHLKLTRGEGDIYIYELPAFSVQPCGEDGAHAPRLAQPHPSNGPVPATELIYQSAQGVSIYVCDACAFILTRDHGFVTLAHRHQKMSLRMSLTEAVLYLAEIGGALSFDKPEPGADPTGREHVHLTIWSELRRGPQVFRVSRRIYLPEFYQYTEDAVAATVTEFVHQSITSTEPTGTLEQHGRHGAADRLFSRAREAVTEAKANEAELTTERGEGQA